MKKLLMLMVVMVVGCAADRNDSPDLVRRAKVLSANDLSISIEHSEFGKPIAFRLADEHCAKFHKSAVYVGGVYQTGPDMTSTWRCQ